MSEGDEDAHKPPAAILFCCKMLMVAMPAAHLTIGALYYSDCPREPYIPIYLLVMGGIPLLLALISILPCTANLWTLNVIVTSIISLFSLCWFIAGNWWIYSIYEPSYDMETSSSNGTYCNEILYQFAFWTTNLNYILLGVALFIACCKCLLCRNEGKEQSSSSPVELM